MGKFSIYQSVLIDFISASHDSYSNLNHEFYPCKSYSKLYISVRRERNIFRRSQVWEFNPVIKLHSTIFRPIHIYSKCPNLYSRFWFLLCFWMLFSIKVQHNQIIREVSPPDTLKLAAYGKISQYQAWIWKFCPLIDLKFRLLAVSGGINWLSQWSVPSSSASGWDVGSPWCCNYISNKPMILKSLFSGWGYCWGREEGDKVHKVYQRLVGW